MIKMLLFVCICALLVTSYIRFATKCVSIYLGPTTADQINMSFSNAVSSDYNCYFLGNSRIYRDINPDLFPSVNSYNFAHDNDSYNQMYYKLLYLLQNRKKIDYLIIGTDYFQFSFLSDTRNYIYSKRFSNEYSKDFGNNSWFKENEKYYSVIWQNKQNAFIPLIMYIFNTPVPNDVSYQKPNGQYIAYGNADPDTTIDRDYSILDLQYNYFIKIITTCENEGIELFVVMPPLWSGETKSHTDDERKIIDELIINALANTRYKNNYINYTNEMGLSSYEDFIDITHLKPFVADNFSKYINQKIFGNLR